MRRVTIRNPKSLKTAKARMFDVLVDDEEVYFEVKSKGSENAVIALTEVMDQLNAKGIWLRKRKATRTING